MVHHLLGRTWNSSCGFSASRGRIVPASCPLGPLLDRSHRIDDREFHRLCFGAASQLGGFVDAIVLISLLLGSYGYATHPLFAGCLGLTRSSFDATSSQSRSV